VMTERESPREFPDRSWDDEAADAFEDALDNGGFAPGEEDGDGS
jgi:hypothetical protein